MKKLKFLFCAVFFFNFAFVCKAMDVPQNGDPLIAALSNAVDFDQISVEQRNDILSYVIMECRALQPFNYGLERYPSSFANKIRQYMKEKYGDEGKTDVLKRGCLKLVDYISDEDVFRLLKECEEGIENNLSSTNSAENKNLPMNGEANPLIAALAKAINFERISSERKDEIFIHVPHFTLGMDGDSEETTVYATNRGVDQGSVKELKIEALKSGMRFATEMFGNLRLNENEANHGL